MYPMYLILPFSLNCSFVIAPSVFSNVYTIILPIDDLALTKPLQQVDEYLVVHMLASMNVTDAVVVDGTQYSILCVVVCGCVWVLGRSCVRPCVRACL